MINKNVNYKGYYKNNILLVGFTSCYVAVASTNDQKSCHMYAEVVFILYFFFGFHSEISFSSDIFCLSI